MGDSLKRTSLYVGGSSPGKMLEARFYHEDCVVYDLEDSVAADSKDAARFLVYEAVRYHRPPDKYVLIRVYGIYSAELPEDLEMAVRARPDALRIPKVEHPEEIVNIDREITRIERQAGIPLGQTELWCNIESALGAVHAREIALSSPRVVALALGAEDYCASMGAKRSKDGFEIFYARMQVLEAKGLEFEHVYVAGLEEDLKTTRGLGFDGKTVIHPSQIDIVNRAFTPSDKEIRNALKIVAALEQGAKQHTGVVVVDGSMVDKPVEIRARTVLDQARAAGLLGKERL